MTTPGWYPSDPPLSVSPERIYLSHALFLPCSVCLCLPPESPAFPPFLLLLLSADDTSYSHMVAATSYFPDLDAKAMILGCHIHKADDVPMLVKLSGMVSPQDCSMLK